MRTITDNFKIITVEQKKLGYLFPSRLLPPATLEDIYNVEDSLGFKLSNELKELYSFANGISADKYPSGLIGLIPIHIFLSLTQALEHYKIYIKFDQIFVTWDTKYKPNNHLFPFLTDGAGNIYWVDLNVGSDNYSKIYWTNSYPDSPAYTFDSLTSMFETIAECYLNKVFFLDEDNYLDEDIGKWGELCKQYNPGTRH